MFPWVQAEAREKTLPGTYKAVSINGKRRLGPPPPNLGLKL